MKTFLRRTCAFLLTTSLLPVSAFAWEWRAPITFSDVPESHWANWEIGQIYQKGLMFGVGDGYFAPSGTLTLAEAVTAAVRARAYYDNNTEFALDQNGMHWYDSAVTAAIEAGIITQGQFDSYDRPATRAELVVILGRTLPDDGYKAINDITSLPDVTSDTPYSAEIFKLYQAGILTGSDSYGTFYPDRDITRGELATLLNRLVTDSGRKKIALSPKAADLTVYTTQKRLMINEFPVYGLTVIDGQYYLPLSLLAHNSTSAAYFLDGYESEENYYYVKTHSPYGEVPLLDYWSLPPEGKVMGVADETPGTMSFDGRDYQGGIYTIDGQYPMVNLSLLGAVPQGNDLVLNIDSGKAHYTAVPENDLPGGAVPTLQKNSDRETLLAIHDHLVNLLTYDILVSAPGGTTEEQLNAAAALQEQAWDTYQMSQNVAYSTKYGICEDYADLFLILCIRSGIPCVKVSGVAGGDSHTWNMVYVDGQWLYVDCTWDDPVSKKPVLRYDYFLVGADTLVKDHYWNGADHPMPAEYDPAWELLDPNNITSADMFRKCLIAQVVMANRSGKETFTVSLRVTKSGAYGGIACLNCNYDGLYWWSYRGGYDKATGCYVYHFNDYYGY